MVGADIVRSDDKYQYCEKQGATDTTPTTQDASSTFKVAFGVFSLTAICVGYII